MRIAIRKSSCRGSAANQVHNITPGIVLLIATEISWNFALWVGSSTSMCLEVWISCRGRTSRGQHDGESSLLWMILMIGGLGSPPRLRRGGRWRSQRRGGATRRCRNIQSSASCHELAYSTRNANEGFRVTFQTTPVPLRDRCRCAALPLLISGGEPEKRPISSLPSGDRVKLSSLTGVWGIRGRRSGFRD